MLFFKRKWLQPRSNISKRSLMPSNNVRMITEKLYKMLLMPIMQKWLPFKNRWINIDNPLSTLNMPPLNNRLPKFSKNNAFSGSKKKKSTQLNVKETLIATTRLN